MPDLFVITGANGAGKSTLAKVLLPVELSELDVFDGDKLFVQNLADIFPAKSKSPKYARSLAFEETVQAFEILVSDSLKKGKSFAYEGHFSSQPPWQTIVKFRENKYRIVMVLLMVEDLSISLKRVSERVKTGGHYVTPLEIEKNYFGNLRQLNLHLELLDELIVIDNSKPVQPDLIAHIADGKCIYNNAVLPQWLLVNIDKLQKLIFSE